jgi:hypothetical protein
MRSVSWPPPPVEALPAERDLMVAAERMNRQVARSMVRVLPGCEFDEFEHLYVRSHPLPTKTLNEARISSLPAEPGRVIEQALACFHSRSPLWRLVSPPEWQALMLEPCRVAGLKPGPGTLEMILTSDHYQGTTEGFVSRRVEDMSDLQSFQKTFSLANQLPDSDS